MKRLLLLGLLALVCAVPVRAQQGNTTTIRFAGVPSGACAPLSFGINNATGDLYDCLMGMWNAVGGGGGGTIGGTISATQIAFGTGADTIGGDTAFIWDSTGNKQTIGTTLTLPADANLDNLPTLTDALVVQHTVEAGHYAASIVSQGEAPNAYATGLGSFGVASGTGGATGADIEAIEQPGMGETVSGANAGAGVYAAHLNIGDGTVQLAAAYRGGAVFNSGNAGTIDNAYGFYAQGNGNVQSSTGAIGNSYGFYSAPHAAGMGTITNAYSFYSAGQTSGGTNNYSFYSAASSNFLQSPSSVSCQGLLCLSGTGYGNSDNFGTPTLLWLEQATGGIVEAWHRAGEPASEYYSCSISTAASIACFATADNANFTGYTINPATDQFLFDDAGGGATYPMAPRYGTLSNCADSAGAAACGSASAGSVVIDAAATTVVVSTTAVTADSQIFVMYDSSLSTRLSVTCNGTVSLPTVTARTAGASFTITASAAPVTNPGCYSYFIVN